MERILLGLFCLSGLSILSCQSRQYHYVAGPMTWTEAQTYCRQRHTDLATVGNKGENDQLLAVVPSHYKSDVWIGLYSKIQWKWSDGYTGSGADYRSWAPPEPNFSTGHQYCVNAGGNGQWWDDHCKLSYDFICYTESVSETIPKFIHVTDKMNWSDAQNFCRKNYKDLATVRSGAENQELQGLMSNYEWGWIGLYREPDIYWSDGSGFLFTHWLAVVNPLADMTVVCGVANLEYSGKWKVHSCEERLPFVCYGPGTKQVIKLKIKQDSSVDLNHPAVKASILKNLQDKLKQDGLSEVTLKWRIQPDGKVFHKEGRCSEMKNSKRPNSADEQSPYFCDL